MPEPNQSATGYLYASDWMVLGLYLVVTFGISIYARRRQRTEADYFLAGRSMPPIIAAVSLFATLFSTLSFVAIPGEAYRHGALFYLSSLGYALFTPLAVWLFLRFLYGQGEASTLYQYLEQRFDGRVRTLAAVIFLISRSLYAATALYAGALLFNAMSGASLIITILLMGGFTVFYTTIGGMRGVMFTDLMQTIIIFIGVGVIGIRLAFFINYDFSGMWQFAADHGHGFGRLFEADFYHFSLYDRYSFWQFLLIYALLAPLQDYGADQLVVQRLLSSKNYSDAKRAVCIKTVMALPLMATFYFLGLLLFYYYNAFRTPPAGISADRMLGYFVTSELPPPIPGLVAAAMLAALMSTVSSVVNSLATVTSIDLWQRWLTVSQQESRKVATGKLLTLLWGIPIVGLAAAMTLAGQSGEASVLEYSKIILVLWGVLLVIVLAGVLGTAATANAAVIALCCGIAVSVSVPILFYFRLPADERISFGWIGVPGIVVTAVVVFAASVTEKRLR